MKSKGILKKFFCVTLAGMLCIPCILGIASIAVEEQTGETKASEVSTSEVLKITDDSKKKELLGFTDNEDLGILGIASKYSLFVKEDATLSAADSEGKIAIGGKLEAQTDYLYQAGCDYDNYKEDSKEAKVVVGKGPIKNIASDFGWNNTTNSKYTDNKNISVNTGFNYDESEYKDYENIDETTGEAPIVKYDKSTFKEANLFDFDEQFEYLNNVSQKLKYSPNGKVEYEWDYNTRTQEYYKHYFVGRIATDYARLRDSYGYNVQPLEQVEGFIVLKGTNEKINIFNIPSGWYRGSSSADIIVDVPYGSYCVLNIPGSSVTFPQKINMYYPMSEEEIANGNMNEEVIGYANGYSSPEYLVNESVSHFKDENGNLKLFHKINPGPVEAKVKNYNTNEENTITRNIDINNPSSKYILWNLHDATSFDLSSIWGLNGSILAPNASGHDSGVNGLKKCYAQVSGNIICKSYTGSNQFGYIPFKASLSDINIGVKNSDNSNIKGAELELYNLETDEKGELILNDKTLIKRFKTTDGTKNVKLPTGGYLLKQTETTDEYKKIDKDNYQAFTVENNYSYSGNGEKPGTFSMESKIEKGFTERKASIIVNSAGPYGHIPSSWGELYGAFAGGLMGYTKGQQKRVYKMKAKINDTREDKSDKLYYTVSSSYSGASVMKTGYAEITKWTEVEGDTIEFYVPIGEFLYQGFKINFFTEDGESVIDGVSVSDVYAYWRTGVDGEINTTFTVNNLKTEVSGTTLNIINEKIETRETKTTKKMYESMGDIFELTANKLVVVNKLVKGSVKVNKVDTDDVPVEGVEFGLFKEGESEPVETKTTNAEGEVVFNDVIGGNYIVKEINVPKEYIKSNEEKNVKVDESKEYSVSFTNKYTKLEVEKVDENGNPLKNAKMQILDKNGNVAHEWITDENVHIISKKLKTGETYTLVEKQVPYGYTKAEDIIFNVTDEGKIISNSEEVTKITVVDNIVKGTIIVNKTGEAFEGTTLGEKIAGFVKYIFNYVKVKLENATFELYAREDIIVDGETKYKKDDKIAEGKTDITGKVKFENLFLGKYYVVEKEAPNGYEKNKQEIDLVLTYQDENTPLVVQETTINNERVKANVKVIKQEKDKEDTKIKGAIYGIYNVEDIGNIKAGTLLTVAVTDENGEGNFDIDLPIGKYKVKEIEAPQEYLLSDEEQEIDFTQTQEFTLTFEDDYTKVQIMKIDFTTGKDVIGATLQILDKDGNVLEAYNSEGTEKVKLEWVTEAAVDENGNLVTDEQGNAVAKEVKFTKLPVGEYTLREVQAPDAYVKAEDIKFKVEETDTIQKVGMKDDFTKVKVNKVDEEENFVEGAKLVVKDKDRSIVEEWTTSKETHEIIKKLVPGEKYILEEVEAPKGYQKAENIEFTVSEDGREDIIKMVDKKKVYIPQTGQLFIVYYAVVAIACASGIILFAKRRKEEEKQNSK